MSHSLLHENELTNQETVAPSCWALQDLSNDLKSRNWKLIFLELLCLDPKMYFRYLGRDRRDDVFRKEVIPYYFTEIFVERSATMVYLCLCLFNDLLSPSIPHHTVCSVISAHNISHSSHA